MKESAELKKTKRIKHCFTRQEIYHRFIHSDEYAYTPKGNHKVSCKGNYLVLQDIGKKATIEDIEDMWYYNRDRMVAIIDRDKKRILINKKYDFHYYDLTSAVPNDYTIYFTKKYIPTKDILSDTEKCLKLHAQYLIEEYAEMVLPNFYGILLGIKNNINYTIDGYTGYSCYYRNKIIKFVTENKVKKYSFYKECLDTDHEIKIYNNGWNYTSVGIKLPTLKQIVDNTVFTKKQKLLLEQKYFWTTYCYGNNIPFKDVVANWNKEVAMDDMFKYLSKKMFCHTEWFTTESKWTQYVITAVNKIREIRRNYINQNIKISDENYKAAKEKLEEILKTKYNIDDWRERRIPTKIPEVTYKKFIVPRRNCSGEWIESRLVGRYYESHIFNNIQLRLTSDKRHIETSRYARVTLSDGIKMYKMFTKARKEQPYKTRWDTSSFGDIKVGIYNLRFIEYKTKETDSFKQLDYCEWVIQIGCHSLWLDDIENFIHYYHLEKEFGLN